ncbi:hypothetical protein [Pseudogemmobacter bohemicus]|uniref:hypothetical protein n=1 Tax=Pseudogemmobacter bohemicus TaxID=2250708 RepID=UPI001300417A|nr:hypothetical protein [Pseudogemmobacter bohemicus]
MKMILRLSCMALVLSAAGTCQAEQTGTIVTNQCFALNNDVYDAHLTVRIFKTEIGSGQFDNGGDLSLGFLTLGQLARTPITCSINGRVVRLETMDFSPQRISGPSALADQVGFRLSVGDHVMWEVPAPAIRGLPIFNGTIDVDKDKVRVCAEHTPEDLGVILTPLAKSSGLISPIVLVCQTYN